MVGRKILVVGGYGGVGQIIAKRLGDKFPGQVIAAGRNYEKAKRLAIETHHRVLPMELDVLTCSASSLSEVGLVVMCIDQEGTEFVESCIQCGIDYIDITASYDFHSKIEALDAIAKEHSTTAVLSVGLAPGITNLLASHSQSLLDQLDRIDIYVMLGLGEEQGKASIRWTLKNLGTEFSIREAGSVLRLRNFGEASTVYLPGQHGKRTAYRFNFSDQHALLKTLETKAVATWLCFDSALVTRLLALIKKFELSKVLNSKSIQPFLIEALKKPSLGSDAFVLKVNAKGTINQKATSCEVLFAGHGEVYATGLVASKVVEHIYEGSFPFGVFHIDQLFTPLEFIENLRADNFNFSQQCDVASDA